MLLEVTFQISLLALRWQFTRGSVSKAASAGCHPRVEHLGCVTGGETYIT